MFAFSVDFSGAHCYTRIRKVWHGNTRHLRHESVVADCGSFRFTELPFLFWACGCLFCLDPRLGTVLGINGKETSIHVLEGIG